MKNISEMKSAFEGVEGQWDKAIALLRKVLTGESLTFVWKSATFPDLQGEYSYREVAETTPFGDHYAMVSNCPEGQLWDTNMGDQGLHSNGEYAAGAQIREQWVICPLFMEAFKDFITNVENRGETADWWWLTTGDHLLFNVPLLRNFLDTIDNMDVLITSYPRNPRQAAAMGLDPRFFL